MDQNAAGTAAGRARAPEAIVGRIGHDAGRMMITDAELHQRERRPVMGMDVYGRNPKSEAGQYFRASVWSWRPIHQWLAENCSDVIPEKTMRQLGFNDGAGSRSERICEEIADRLEQYLAYHPDGLYMEDSVVRTNPNTGQLFSADSVPCGVETVSPYQTSPDHLREFIEFLRNCGGFRVY
jgi:hypothetical protein